MFGKDLKKELSELNKFEKLSEDERSIVVYVENEYYYIYLKSIIKELTEHYGINICYITSSKTDPILKNSNDKILAFYIGSGIIRTKFFLNLKAKVLITTMPDLQTFHIKRSKISNVKYVYVFHSLVSTHLVYRINAFDNYDLILCTGDYQIQEIQERESKYNLKSKKLIKCGYGRLDDLIIEYKNWKRKSESVIKTKQVLIAPSWGENGLIETIGDKVVNELLELNYKVILRPHPMTVKKFPKKVQKIKEKYNNNKNFYLEEDIRTFDSFYSSDCVISDWSGVALEYAFTTKKPVLFIDVPTKMRNLEYEKISLVPLEVRIRNQIGDIISPDNISELGNKIELIIKNQQQYVEKIENIHQELIFNIQHSGNIAAKEILKLINYKIDEK